MNVILKILMCIVLCMILFVVSFVIHAKSNYEIYQLEKRIEKLEKT